MCKFSSCKAIVPNITIVFPTQEEIASSNKSTEHCYLDGTETNNCFSCCPAPRSNSQQPGTVYVMEVHVTMIVGFVHLACQNNFM